MNTSLLVAIGTPLQVHAISSTRDIGTNELVTINTWVGSFGLGLLLALSIISFIFMFKKRDNTGILDIRYLLPAMVAPFYTTIIRNYLNTKIFLLSLVAALGLTGVLILYKILAPDDNYRYTGAALEDDPIDWFFKLTLGALIGSFLWGLVELYFRFKGH